MTKKTVQDIEIREGQGVLLRADFNVPLEDGEVADETRIAAALPTIRYLMERKARTFIAAHLGRPKGRVVEMYRLAPVARRLSKLLGVEVSGTQDCVGPEAERAKRELPPGGVLLLENTRFHREEMENEKSFAEALAKEAELFVEDAFGAVHRAHASTEGVARLLPAVSGLLLEQELEVLEQVRDRPEHPYVVILGGAKISDKIGAVNRFLEVADLLLIGGGMANTFLKARGAEVGTSLVEEGALDQARRLLEKGGEKILLPMDAVVTDHIRRDAMFRVDSLTGIAPQVAIADIGPRTRELFKERLADAKLVVWNGPMGVFEIPPFDEGTMELAETLAGLDAKKVIGGGDTVSAVNRAGVAHRMTHVSTGGGSFIEYHGREGAARGGGARGSERSAGRRLILPTGGSGDPAAFEHLLRFLEAGSVLVLSGAGISTESGIPDYRGPDGVLQTRPPISYREFTGGEEVRRRYWSRSTLGWPRTKERKPNAGHRALAELERSGFITGIITQNVDGLHQAAGSSRVLELHGTLDQAVCMRCWLPERRDGLQERLTALNPGWQDIPARIAPDGDAEIPPEPVATFRIPACIRCGGTLKPDFVFFGEDVPRGRVERAWRMLGESRALLVLGSSLTVYSGYRFAERAVRDGKPLGIVNHGATRADRIASFRLDAKLGTVLPELVKRVLQGSPAPESGKSGA